MSNGRVCSIHNEWCADGSCRWCEPLPETSNPWAATGWYTVNQQAQQGISDCLSRLGALNQQAQQQAIYAPTETGSGFPWGFPTWGHWK